MRALFVLLSLFLLVAASPSRAQEPPDLKGLWLTAAFPDVTLRVGEEAKLDLTLFNYGLPPQRVDLTVAEAPPGWETELSGDGRTVGAAFVAPDEQTKVKLNLSPPADAGPGSYRFRLRAEGETASAELPLTIRLAEAAPPRLTLEPEFPALRGTASSTFSFRVTVENDSGEDAVVNLVAEAPPGFQVSFKKAFGSQELTSLPVKAGEDEKVDVAVDLPQDLPAGRYQVVMRAATERAQSETPLMLDVTGRPELRLTGLNGRLSGAATLGKETSFTLQLENRGSAEARGIEFSARPPSGWKVAFEPKGIDLLPPDETREVTALVTPSDKALAGDYMVTLRANGDGASDSAEFRITVTTSTLWGAAGIGIIAVALLVLVLAVIRYGRR